MIDATATEKQQIKVDEVLNSQEIEAYKEFGDWVTLNDFNKSEVSGLKIKTIDDLHVTDAKALFVEVRGDKKDVYILTSRGLNHQVSSMADKRLNKNVTYRGQELIDHLTKLKLLVLDHINKMNNGK